MVKRLLRKHGYPPDKQEQATAIVTEQAECLCETEAKERDFRTPENYADATTTPGPMPIAAECPLPDRKTT